MLAANGVFSGVRLELLGGVRVFVNGAEVALQRGRHRELLALLALRSSVPTSTVALLDALWEGEPPASAESTLYGYISLVRKAIGSTHVVSVGGGYQLADVTIDLHEVADNQSAADEALAAGDAVLGRRALERALLHYRGAALGEFATRTWAQPTAVRYEELRLVTLERLNDLRLEAGEHARLIPELEELLTSHPFRERLVAQLMLALYRSGRQAESLRVYAHLREQLVEALGIEPSSALSQLEDAILLQKSELDRPLGGEPSSYGVRPSRVGAGGPPALAHRGEPGTTLLSTIERPHLVRMLQQRFRSRLTTVVAGPGFGKSTLIAEAWRDNLAAQRGTDVYVPCTPLDVNASHFGEGIMAALGLSGPVPPTVEAIVTSITRALALRAPEHIAVIVDDSHLLLADTGGERLLAQLLAALPANGHLVTAGRRAPALNRTRLRSRHELTELVESDLRFQPDEMQHFARIRGVAVDRLTDADGWPALSELAAVAHGETVREYLWEEVLAAMGASQRRMLACMSLLDQLDAVDAGLYAAIEAIALRADDDVLAGPLEVVRGLPLVALAQHGSVRMHSLWRSPLAGELSALEASEVYIAAAGVLQSRHEFDAAFHLLVDALDAVSSTANNAAAAAVCALITEVGRPAHPPLAADVLAGWDQRLGDRLAGVPERVMLAGLVARAADDTETAMRLLGDAAEAFESADDLEGAAVCLSHVGLLAFWRSDVVRGTENMTRLDALAKRGNGHAQLAFTIGVAMTQNVFGQDEAALVTLDSIDLTGVDDDWHSSAEWARATSLLVLGRGDEALRSARVAVDRANVVFWPEAEGRRVEAMSYLDLESAIDDWWRVLASSRASGVNHHIIGHVGQLCMALLWSGRVTEGQSLLIELADDAQRRPADPYPQIIFDVTRAYESVALGDDESARRWLQSVRDRTRAHARTPWGRSAVLAYGLLDEMRDEIEAAAKSSPYLAQSTQWVATLFGRGDRPHGAPSAEVMPQRWRERLDLSGIGVQG